MYSFVSCSIIASQGIKEFVMKTYQALISELSKLSLELAAITSSRMAGRGHDPARHIEVIRCMNRVNKQIADHHREIRKKQ